MNKLILTPTDVLMLKDARPMEGSLPGHTLTWPTPDIISHALRGALHRSGLQGHHHHLHPQGEKRDYSSTRTCKFGSLTHAGPFPVHSEGGKEEWFFPCPMDMERSAASPTCGPAHVFSQSESNSLPSPLKYGVAGTAMPSKENHAPEWISSSDWKLYLNNSAKSGYTTAAQSPAEVKAPAIADVEQTFGIARDDATACAAQCAFYSASFLRLLPGWSMGSLVSSAEKNAQGGRDDVFASLIPKEKRIVVGGQQRTCTAKLAALSTDGSPIPKADTALFGKCLRVKWVLITPAVWSRHGNHPGGWLPTWVDATTGQVFLAAGNRTRRPNESRDSWRARLKQESTPIAARLVAALTGKPIPITGYAGGKSEQQNGLSAPKSTHLAVPAGSVYYFECSTPEAVEQLVHALDASAAPNLNRRSELLGEQGFGLGVCAPWHFADNQ